MKDDNNDKVIDSSIVEREMVVELSDVEMIRKFFENFELEMPDALDKSLKDFQGNPCISTQRRLVIEMSKAITSGSSSLDKIDDIFKPIIESCIENSYALEFNADMEDILDDKSTQKVQASDRSAAEEPSDS